jgi:DNA processing protein
VKAPPDERIARAALMWLSEPNDRSLAAFVTKVGPEEALRTIRAGDTGLPGLPGVGNYGARLDSCAPERQLESADGLGVRLVVPGDLEWPSQLDQLDLPPEPGRRGAAPPLGLWVRGRVNLRLAAVRSVCVVGSRAATGYGVRVCTDLASGLAEAGWTVLSGGAYGIDAAAHRGALAAGGSTVSVLACGVDVPYPRGNTALFDRIVSEGVLVSELSPGRRPGKVRFLDRNRLIAGLTRGTVIVEAGYRSGALNTAGWARRLGRPVMGVPGPVTSPLSDGVHRELREGRAELITAAGHVIAAAGTMGDALAASAELFRVEHFREATQRPYDALDDLAKRVLDGLPARAAVSAAGLSAECGLSTGLVHQRLVQLCALGLVEAVQSGWRLARTDSDLSDGRGPVRVNHRGGA